jgi:hypothetical protein
VEFVAPVDAKGNIEVWLQRLVDGMQNTVKQVIKRAMHNVYVSEDDGGITAAARCRPCSLDGRKGCVD